MEFVLASQKQNLYIEEKNWVQIHCISSRLFYCLALFQKIFSNTLLTERFQETDPGLGVIHAGVKVTQLGAVNVGAKPSCHLVDDA
jgi:hypothetical protein